jgi:hypothetical protein
MLRHRTFPRWRFPAVTCVTNHSPPFRSAITDDDLMMLPHVASAEHNALRAPSGNANEKIQRSF